MRMAREAISRTSTLPARSAKSNLETDVKESTAQKAHAGGDVEQHGCGLAHNQAARIRRRRQRVQGGVEYKVEWLATVTPRPVVVEFQDNGLSSRREKAFVVGTQQKLQGFCVQFFFFFLKLYAKTLQFFAAAPGGGWLIIGVEY